MKKNLIFLSLIAACFMITSCEKGSDFMDIDSDLKKASKKVTMCHQTGSLSNPWVVIEVPAQAVPSHLNHGDAVDMDGDGFFHIENGCSQIDCDDSNSEDYPVYWYPDDDGDGFGNNMDSILACTPPEGYVANSLDCNDSDFVIGITSSGDTIYFGAGYFCSNCVIYFDGDGDGYGSSLDEDDNPTQCAVSDNEGDCLSLCCWPGPDCWGLNFALNNLDCDDNDPMIGDCGDPIPDCQGYPSGFGLIEGEIMCDDYNFNGR